MSNRPVKVNVFGASFLNLLAVLFIGLKLTHYVDWSWWWVLAPVWVPAAMILAFLGVALAVAALGAVLK